VLIGAHDRRPLLHLTVTASPTAAWIRRHPIQARPWGRTPRLLIRDRAAVHGAVLVPRARRLGVETLLAPVRAPRANAVAEGLVGTLRRECLDRMIILNEAHLRAVLVEFARYYNGHRPHLMLSLDTPRPADRPLVGSVRSRPVLGGLRHVYERAA
jgi:transposase InsO family protein